MSHKKGSASLHLRLMTCKSSLLHVRGYLFLERTVRTCNYHNCILFPVCRIVVQFMLVCVYMCLFFFGDT